MSAPHRTLLARLSDAVLALALGAALAFVLFNGWAGGFRP